MNSESTLREKLRKIEALNYDTLNHRPTVGKADMAVLFLKALTS